MSKLGLLFIASAVVSSGAFAQTPKKGAPPVACPICHMPLSAKKTAANPTAVKLTKKGKVMYCCAKCTMPASVLVKAKKK